VTDPHEQQPVPPQSNVAVADPATGTAPLVTAGIAAEPLTAAQLALHMGWTMAVLYGNVPAAHTDGSQLPTVNELPADERRALELGRLNHLLKRLAAVPACADAGLPAGVPRMDVKAPDLKTKLEHLNLALLDALAAAGPEPEMAYELGRALRDTANPPRPTADTGDPKSSVNALARQLAHGRIAKLQEWLETLATQFPQHAASIVAASMGRWSELAAVTVSTSARTRLKKGDKERFAEKMYEYLLPQGDLWLTLLVGARSTSGLLSPEAYVAAGEAALRRSAAIGRKILQHYWVALFLVGAALVASLYLAVTYLGGAAKVWTSIAAIVGSLGISAQAIASAMARLGAEAERPVFGLAEEDAMAWAITTLPQADLTSRGVMRLRKAGVAPTAGLGRV